jgi:hypothetical protein
MGDDNPLTARHGQPAVETLFDRGLVATVGRDRANRQPPRLLTGWPSGYGEGWSQKAILRGS